MRWTRVLVLAIQLAAVMALVGCHAWAPVVVAAIASIAVFHRGLGDLVVSAVSGRDCSVVRLDRGTQLLRPPRRAAGSAGVLHPQPRHGRLLGHSGLGAQHRQAGRRPAGHDGRTTRRPLGALAQLVTLAQPVTLTSSSHGRDAQTACER